MSSLSTGVKTLSLDWAYACLLAGCRTNPTQKRRNHIPENRSRRIILIYILPFRFKYFMQVSTNYHFIERMSTVLIARKLFFF